MMFSKLIHVVPYCTCFFLFNVSVIFYSLSVPASSGKSERDWRDHTATVSSLCGRRGGCEQTPGQHIKEASWEAWLHVTNRTYVLYKWHIKGREGCMPFLKSAVLLPSFKAPLSLSINCLYFYYLPRDSGTILCSGTWSQEVSWISPTPTHSVSSEMSLSTAWLPGTTVRTPPLPPREASVSHIFIEQRLKTSWWEQWKIWLDLLSSEPHT